MTTPFKLIDEHGNCKFGIFSLPVDEVNYRDYHLRTPFGRNRHALAKHFAFNQFQFVGVLSPELVIGCALMNVKYVGGTFFYVFDPHTKVLDAVKILMPLGWLSRFDQKPEEGNASFRWRDSSVEIRYDPATKSRTLYAQFLKRGLFAEINFAQEAWPAQPLAVCTPTGPTGWSFTRKTAGAPALGQVKWKGRNYDLAAIHAYAVHDWTAGFMRRHTFWNWAAFAGKSKEGHDVGVNASCGVNETSFTENCFWLDGHLHKVDNVAFTYDRYDLYKPWQIHSYDRKLKLEFIPESEYAQRVNALVVATNFRQMLGYYRGYLDTGKERITVDHTLGYAESHYAKW